MRGAGGGAVADAGDRRRNGPGEIPPGDAGRLWPQRVRQESVAPTRKALAPERIFLLQRVFVKIKHILIAEQVFIAQYYMELRAPGGALDTRFYKRGFDGLVENTMTEEDNAECPVVPSVLWYLTDQFRLINSNKPVDASDFKERKVLRRGDDLMCILRFEGEFQEIMELQEFPLDVQELTLQVEIQCAIGASPFPVKLELSPDMVSSIDREAFNLKNEYDLAPFPPKATAFAHSGIKRIAGSEANRYPAIAITCTVRRQCGYFLYNVVAPMGMISFLSIATAFTMAEPSDRIATQLALLLTAAAYKLAITAMVPAVSYLTLLDRYIGEQCLYLMVVTIVTSLFGMRSGPIPIVHDVELLGHEADLYSLYLLLGMWFVLQLKTYCVWRTTMREKKQALRC